MDNTVKFKISQMIKGQEPKVAYQLLESIQKYCEEHKRCIAEKVNVPHAEVVIDD